MRVHEGQRTGNRFLRRMEKKWRCPSRDPPVQSRSPSAVAIRQCSRDSPVRSRFAGAVAIRRCGRDSALRSITIPAPPRKLHEKAPIDVDRNSISIVFSLKVRRQDPGDEGIQETRGSRRRGGSKATGSRASQFARLASVREKSPVHCDPTGASHSRSPIKRGPSLSWMLHPPKKQVGSDLTIGTMETAWGGVCFEQY